MKKIIGIGKYKINKNYRNMAISNNKNNLK